jgi:hypothetical protein
VSAYALLRARPTLSGLVARAALAAAFFALAAACRSSVGLTLPGLLLALGLGLQRADAGRSRRALAFAAILALFLLPYPLMSRSQGNDVWQPLWEGLGDFDRSHGYTWSDEAAERFAVAHGAPGLWTPESEDVFRRAVLNDVAGEPLWFGSILWQRAVSTVSLRKLWPRGAVDGRATEPDDSENAGVMDKYWSYTPTADRFAVGRARVEVPVALLLLPPMALVFAAWRSPDARRWLLAAGCLAVAVLPLPILITTAGGQEPQAIILAYLLAAAALLDLLAPLAPSVASLAGRVRGGQDRVGGERQHADPGGRP